MKITAQLISGNVATNYLATIATFIYTLLLTPFILSHIGTELYGVWLTCQIFISYLSYLDLETDTALVKYLAQYWSEEDSAEADGLFTTLFFVYCLIGLIIFLCSMCFARILVPHLNLSSLFSSTAADIFPLVGFNVMIAYLALAFNCALMAKARYSVINILSILSSIAGGLLILFVLPAGGSLRELILIDSAIKVFKLAATAFYVLKLHRFVSIHVHRFDLRHFRRIKAFTFWYFLSNSLGDSLSKLSTLYISACFSASHLTAVVMYFKLPDVLEAVASPVYGFFMPIASSLNGKKDYFSLKRMHLLGTRLVLLIILPGLVLFYVKGNHILELWLDDQFMFLEGVLPVVLTTGAINLISTPAHLIVIGVGGVKLSFRSQLFTAVLTLILIAVLWPLKSAAEVIIAFCLADLLVEIFYFVPKSCRLTHIRLSYLIKRIYIPFLMMSLLLVALAHFYFKVFPDNSLLNFSVASLLLLAMTIVGGATFILDAEDKAYLLRPLAEWLSFKRDRFLKSQS
jgi:O-antigen/teichoic acid export membrane protein